MSTTGKVLTVLVALVAAVWVVLTAAVTQLNRNGAAQIASLKGQVAKLEGELEATRLKLRELKDETHRQQSHTDSRLAVVEERRSDAEKARAWAIESQTRAQFELQSIQATVKAAEQDKERRIAELTAERKAKADAEESVKTLKSQNAELLAELARQREHLKSTLDADRSLVEQERGAAASFGAPVVP